MPVKDFYELLGVAPAASPDDVKKAFRAQIAKYHPDKVHHLGKEFQDMAAERAAELTEAYRILSHESLRGEYDRARQTDGVAPAAAAPATARREEAPPPPPAAAPQAPPPEAGSHQAGAQFKQERASRDEFVRQATVGRVKQAIAATIGDGYDPSSAQGFDLSYTPKAKLFGRGKGPRLLGRFVGRVDGPSVTEAWNRAGQLNAPSSEEICVLLMGSGMAPKRELEDAIAQQRRKPARGAKVTLIPVDLRDWDAHIPTDAPAVAKSLITRLRTGQ